MASGVPPVRGCRRCDGTGPHKNLNLPDEIMNEIFIRCSVESLLCAKCVCKHWNALIINPDFTFNHLQYQKRHDKGRLLLQHFKEETKRYGYLLFNDETLTKDTYRELAHFPFSEEHLVQMEGPIDGLYCLFNCLDRIIVWNPALKKFRCLALPHPNFLPHIKAYAGVIGFGIDPLTNDYKLVLIRWFENIINYDSGADLNVTVYNFSTNTWKLFDLGDYPPLDVTRNLNNAYLNGMYYWSDFVHFPDIVAFDMGTELFRKISGPKISRPEFSFSRLTIYKDHVASLALGRSHIDVWVMLDEDNWVHQLSITHPSVCDLTAGLWKTGDILYAIPEDKDSPKYNPNSQMVLCNMKTRETRNVGPKGLLECYHVSVYYESLVSVDCGTKQKGKHVSLNMVSNFLDRDVDPYLEIIRP